MINLGKNPVIELINKGDLDLAENEISKNVELRSYEDMITLALIKRYKGDINQAIAILEGIYNNQEDLSIFHKLRCTFLLFFCYYTTDASNPRISELREELNYLHQHVLAHELGPYWQGMWENIKAIRSESRKNLSDAITSYSEANEFFEKEGNKYELMMSDIQVATVYKNYGDFLRAQEYIERGLKLAIGLKVGQYQAQFLTFLAELLFLRSKLNYNQALEYLQSARSLWLTANINTGIAWVDQDLGILNLLMGNLQQSFDYLKSAYELSRDQKNVNYHVTKLLSLIAILSDMGDLDESKIYLEKLRPFANESTLYKNALSKAEEMVVRSTQKLAFKMFSLKIFNNLSSENHMTYEIKLKSLINHLELLLTEMRFAEANEPPQEGRGFVEQIQDYTNHSYDLLVHATLLIDKFNSLEETNQEIPFNTSSIKELNPTIHFIQRLTIILYLLPRKGILYGDLEIASDLPAEKVTDQINKLVNDGIISSRKITITEQTSTVYKMTEKGIKEFRDYIQSVIDIFKDFFTN